MGIPQMQHLSAARLLINDTAVNYKLYLLLFIVTGGHSLS